MTFWIVAGAVCVVLLALAWWTSGRSKRRPIDGRRRLVQSEEFAQHEQTRIRLDPGGPFLP